MSKVKTGIYLGLLDEQLLLFADIIGFKEIIKQNRVTRKDTQNVLMTDLTVINKHIVSKYSREQQRALGIKFIWCSDTICVSTSKENSKVILDVLDDIANLFFCSGLVLRGNITIGELYHDENIWGPAFLHAFDLEKTDKYPRIIISDDTLSVISDASHHEYFDFFVESETYGYSYFDYIEYIIKKSIKLGVSFPICALNVYIQTIQGYYLNATEEKQREKWVWYAKEISRAIRNNAKAIDDDFTATIEKGRTSLLEDIVGHERYLRDLESIVRGEFNADASQ